MNTFLDFARINNMALLKENKKINWPQKKKKSDSSKRIWFWFGLMLNVLVNNFSVMLGRSHRFLGITSTFGG